MSCRNMVQRRDALGQPALEQLPLGRGMMRGIRSNGKMRSMPPAVAVDREGDALVQKGSVGQPPPLGKTLQRQTMPRNASSTR